MTAACAGLQERHSPEVQWRAFIELWWAKLEVRADEEAVKRTLAWPLPHENLIVIYMAQGRKEEAREKAAEFLERFPNFSLDQQYEAWPLRNTEAKDLWFARMREAGLK